MIKCRPTRQQIALRSRIRGNGAIVVTQDGLRFLNLPCTEDQYTNAQFDDTTGRKHGEFPWRPPLTLSVRARFSHAVERLTGTAGFGLWNDPFMMSGARRPALPQVLWFFLAGPSSDMSLALDIPGRGWKAAAMNTAQPSFVLLAPLAPIGIFTMHFPWLYRRFWPVAQQALGVAECLIPVDIRDWHQYSISWDAAAADFFVDGNCVLHAGAPAHGPLGLVIWMDSQAMVVRPTGEIRHRLVAKTETQWMEVADLVLYA